MSPVASLQLDAKTLAIMRCIDTLEQSEAAAPSDLRQFLSDVPPEHHADALAELVRVDLERQWTLGHCPEVSKYLSDYPEVRSREESVLDLLQTDFALRQAKGDCPDASEYHRLHPGFKPRAAASTCHSAQATAHYVSSDVRLAPPGPAPARIGKYRIERELGKGGFGVVYQAYDEQLERWVALKIRRGAGEGAGLDEDLLHEARSIARLDHPNIVRLLDAGETADHQGYIAYEHIDGETLREVIDRYEHDPARAADWFSQSAEWIALIADALHYAHQHGIVHRDVKPANIMIDQAGGLKLLDFGLARRDDAYYRNDARQVLGTLTYMSPEQAGGDSHWASSQSDIYSLGVVLYELLCRRLPFPPADAGEMLEQTLHRAPPPPRSIDDSIPTGLEQACLQALAKLPGERFATGADMAAAVRQAVAPPRTWLPTLVRSGAVLVAVAALGVASLALLLPHGTPPAAPPEISSYNLFLFGDETPVNGHLPLTSRNPLKVEATFTCPAYAYLIVFEQQSTGKLYWPPPADFAQQQPLSRLIYPSLAGDTSPLPVPDADGAMFVVALASPTPLSRQAIAALLDAKLDLNVAPEVAARAKTSFEVADPAPKFHQGIPTRGPAATDLRVPETLKQALRGLGGAYLGDIVPHVKSGPPSGE